MKYRADIDGLRAIAVLAVVAYHYNFRKLIPGGYVGVDIFFVISGFLITRIIFDEINQRTYSIADFYERRVRRIFPALFVMFGACLITAYMIGLQAEIAETGRSIAASIFFMSNILFYSSTNYFNDDLIRNPLLHTWSLSVEEQFYVLFPVFMFFIRNYSLQWKKWMLVALALVSFFASIWQVNSEPTGAFYLVYFRAWELLLGGLVAIGVFPQIQHRLALEGIALTGLAALVASIGLYGKTTAFPGLAAALPCCGTAAIIYAGANHQTWVSRLLSVRPAQFFGWISYSLYLWHWPLVAYYANYQSIEGATRIQLFVVAVIISTASWWFVERPFRTRPYRLKQKAMLGAAVTTMLVMGAIALGSGPIRAKYWPDSEDVNRLAAFVHYDNVETMRTGSCLVTSRKTSLNPECLKLSADKMNVLILGDSHAAHLWAGYQATYPDINFLQATGAGCRPFINNASHKHCKALMHYMYETFLPANRVDLIIVSGRWASSEVADAIKIAGDLRKYAARVVISGPVPEYDLSLPFLLAHAEDQGKDLANFSLAHLQPERKTTDQLFASAQLPEGVTYVSVYDALCAPTCIVTVGNNIPVQFDYGHLTKEGAIYLADKVGTKVIGI